MADQDQQPQAFSGKDSDTSLPKWSFGPLPSPPPASGAAPQQPASSSSAVVPSMTTPEERKEIIKKTLARRDMLLAYLKRPEQKDFQPPAWFVINNEIRTLLAMVEKRCAAFNPDTSDIHQVLHEFRDHRDELVEISGHHLRVLQIERDSLYNYINTIISDGLQVDEATAERIFAIFDSRTEDSWRTLRKADEELNLVALMKKIDIATTVKDNITTTLVEGWKEIDRMKEWKYKLSKEAKEAAVHAGGTLNNHDGQVHLQTGTYAQQHHHHHVHYNYAPGMSVWQPTPQETFAPLPHRPHPGFRVPVTGQVDSEFPLASVLPIRRKMMKPKSSSVCRYRDACSSNNCDFIHPYQRVHFGHDLENLPAYVPVREKKRKIKHEEHEEHEE